MIHGLFERSPFFTARMCPEGFELAFPVDEVGETEEILEPVVGK